MLYYYDLITLFKGDCKVCILKLSKTIQPCSLIFIIFTQLEVRFLMYRMLTAGTLPKFEYILTPGKWYHMPFITFRT
jgi:hypothetical protein